MATLAPPPARHRASSTNVRPPLTIQSLGRRRSNSLLDIPSTPGHTPGHTPPRTPPPTDLPITPQSIVIPPLHLPVPRSGFSSMVSRWWQAIHLSSDHSYPSTPSSPRLSRASTDDSSILPIAESPIRSSFSENFPEKPLPPKSRPWTWEGSPSVHIPVLFVLMLFPVSTALVVYGMSTLPITMAWPKTLADLARLGRELHSYSQSGPGSLAHVVGVVSIAAVWKHAWSIPGSVIWNVLAGALLSPISATVLLTFLTTVGSIFASILSAPMAPFLSTVFPRALALTRTALEGDSSTDDPLVTAASTSKASKSSAWVRLSVLRLIGVVPWSGINIACGVCGVALWDCFLGSMVGSLPWTAVTCQVGDILQTVASAPSPTPQTVQSLLTSPDIIIKLAFLSFLSLAPILLRKRLHSWISSTISSASRLDEEYATEKDSSSRWVWVRDWAGRIRVPSRSGSRDALREQLERLTREKSESLPL